MTVSFALIEDVWSQSAAFAQGKPKSKPAVPRGGGPCLPPSLRPGTSGSKSASKRGKPSDPLCDLYEHGYCGAMDDIMDAYTPGDSYASLVDDSSARAPSSSLSPSYGPAAPLHQPQDGSGGPPGANDDDGAAAYAPFDGATEFIRGRDAPEGADFNGPPAPDDGHSDEATPATRELAAPPKATPTATATSTSTSNTPNAIHTHTAATGTNASIVHIALYVVSGVILIFLLEQFIQIGMRMRGAGIGMYW